MDFGQALNALRENQKVARYGWNGWRMIRRHDMDDAQPKPVKMERPDDWVKVERHGGKGMWLMLQRPDSNSKMTLPYIYIEYPAGHPAYPAGCRVPWLASQTDLLAEDWTIV